MSNCSVAHVPDLQNNSYVVPTRRTLLNHCVLQCHVRLTAQKEHNSAQNIDFGYSLEPPRRGGSNEYP